MFKLNDIDIVVSGCFSGYAVSAKVLDLTFNVADSVNNKTLKCIVMGIGAGTAAVAYFKTFTITNQILSVVKDKIYHKDY